jgi:hypothetical protein
MGGYDVQTDRSLCPVPADKVTALGLSDQVYGKKGCLMPYVGGLFRVRAWPIGGRGDPHEKSNIDN